MPVDTHVYQIALKHYGFTSRAKGTMTPKLYEDLNHKFLSIWGDYAGWAHSVSFRFLHYFKIKYNNNNPFPQVLFTADLKSFSSYGLEPPSALLPSNSSTPEESVEKHPQPLESVLDRQIPPVTPSVSPLKRKWDPELGDHVGISPVNIAEEDAKPREFNDGVKKRR